MSLPEDHMPLGGQNVKPIPNAKEPKARPPRGFRDSRFFPGRSLPPYSGPYSVGTMEIEVPARDPRTFSHIKREHKHLLRLETVLITLYYPAAHGAQHRSESSRMLWFGRPRLGMASGYSRFAGLPTFLCFPFFLPSILTKLPAYRNADIASHYAVANNVKEGGVNVKMESGVKPEGAPDTPEFPVLIFSHGLGGTRTMYSSVCGEYASYGFMVCAIEHRDGSGPRTYINHAMDSSTEGGHEERETAGGIDHHEEEKANGFEIVDYVHPLNNPLDTSPNNPKGVDRDLRAAQVELRMAEIEEAFEVLKMIANGEGHKVAEKNMRVKGNIAASSHGLEGVDWDGFKGKIRLDHVTACGHSFGAATVTEMLRHGERFSYISQGIILDIWGAGIQPHEVAEPNRRIRAPLLAINSEAFTYWPRNFELVDTIARETQGGPNPRPSWLMTIRGTVHVSYSDIVHLYPHICSVFLKMVAEPKRALDLTVNASLEFFSHVLPPDMAHITRAYRNEGLLEHRLNPLADIPAEQLHRPHDKYLAARLHIRHEWLFRISPELFRKTRRIKAQRQGRSDDVIGDEIWLHVKPPPHLLDSHKQKTTKDPEALPDGDRVTTEPVCNEQMPESQAGTAAALE